MREYYLALFGVVLISDEGIAGSLCGLTKTALNPVVANIKRYYFNSLQEQSRELSKDNSPFYKLNVNTQNELLVFYDGDKEWLVRASEQYRFYYQSRQLEFISLR